MKINPEDSCAEAKRASKIDAVYSMVAKKKRKTFKKSDQNPDRGLQNPNTKIITYFD